MCAPEGLQRGIDTKPWSRLTKGIVESLVYILDPANKRDVGEMLKKNLRLSKDEDVEAAYKVARLQMPNLDIAPNLEAWRTFKRLVAGSIRKFRKSTGASHRHRPGAKSGSQRLPGGDAKKTAAMKNTIHHEGTKVDGKSENFPNFVSSCLRGAKKTLTLVN